ncbi:hypothetical protein [Aureisphaera sp.]
MEAKKKKPIKKGTLICLLLATVFYGCSNEYCNELHSAVVDIYNPDTDKNIVDLKEVYDFEWDILYIFKEYEHPDTISEIIGFDCHCEQVGDSEEMYLFVKDNLVVEIDTGECDGYSLSTNITICCDGAKRIDSYDSKFSIGKGNEIYGLWPLNEKKKMD